MLNVKVNLQYRMNSCHLYKEDEEADKLSIGFGKLNVPGKIRDQGHEPDITLSDLREKILEIEKKLEPLLATPPIRISSCVMDLDPTLEDGQQLDFECAIRGLEMKWIKAHTLTEPEPQLQVLYHQLLLKNTVFLWLGWQNQGS